MKRKMASKALSLLLALCMVIGLLPGMTLTASAVGGSEYATAELKLNGYTAGANLSQATIEVTSSTGFQSIQLNGFKLPEDVKFDTIGAFDRTKTYYVTIKMPRSEGYELQEADGKPVGVTLEGATPEPFPANKDFLIFKMNSAPAAAAPTFDDDLGKTDCAFDTYQKNQTNAKGYTFAGWFDGDGDELTSASAAQAGSTYTAKWTKNGKTVRTTPLDFYDSAADEWQTGCTQSDTLWTNAAEGWSWDTASKTLTLNGVTIDTQVDDNTYAAIGVLGDATIETVDGTENFVYSRSEDGENAAIFVEGDLTIRGNGKLTVFGEEAGIYAEGDIAINAPITATSTGTSKGCTAILAVGGNTKVEIKIDSSLSIVQPADGRALESEGVAWIAEANNEEPVSNVVIDAAAPTFTDGLGNANCAFNDYKKGDTNSKGYTFAGWFDGDTELESAEAAVPGTTYIAKWTKNGKTVRTTSLDLTVISESNTLGATYNNGVYVNTAEGWTWMPGNNGGTLLLESCTIDTADSSGIKLNHMSVRIAMDGESSVTATGNNGCGIDQTAVGGMLEIAKTSGEKGSLTLSGRYRGICTKGPVTIQSGNVTATGSGGVDCMSLEVLGGELTATGTSEYGIYAHSGSGSSMTYGAVEIGEYGEVTATGDIGIVCGRLSVDGTLTAQGDTKAVWVVGAQGANLAPTIANGLVVKTNTAAGAGDGAYDAEQIATYKWLNIAAPKIPFFTDGLGNADCAFDDYQKGATNEKGYTFAGWFNGETELTSADDAVAGTTYTAKWTKNGKTVRTAVLDLTKISEENTFGATLADGVYTNEAEGWSWNPETKTLTLSGATMDIQLDGSYIGICLPAGATVATAKNTENAVSVRALSGCAISGVGDITISGQGTLQVVGVNAGVCTDGDIAINAPISVSVTGDEAIAIYIESESAHSITIHDALDILTPTGGVIGYGGICITESDETTPARSVVIGVAVKYTVTYNTNGGSAIAPVTVTENRKLTAPEAPTKDGYTFLGWYKDAAFTNGWNFDADTVTGNLTLYAKWAETTKTYGISGTVYESNGTTPASSVTVKLMKGDTPVAAATSASDGTYSFTGIAPGVYNIVAEQGDVMQTTLVIVKNQNEVGKNITMPDGAVSSKLTVSGADTPDVVAGGLAEESAAVKAENSSATSVKVEMTVESKSSEEVNTADKTNIETVAPGKTLEYLDIKVTKTIDDGSPETMSTTTSLMEIIIPYDMTGKSNITVYRNHSGSAAAFTRLSILPGSGAADGTYYLDTANHLIYVYTKNFSTYAIGYTVPFSGGSGGSGSSGGSASYPVTIPDSTPDGGKISISPKSASKAARSPSPLPRTMVMSWIN